MNKIKSLVALILVFSVCLFPSCRKNEIDCCKLLGVIEDCFEGKLPFCSAVYKMSASWYSKEYLSPSLASLLYYGEKREQVYEMSLLCDYAVRLADGQSGAEIHVLRVRAMSDRDTVEKMVRRRLDYIKSRSVYIYTPDDYEKYAATAEVFCIKDFVLLLATPDNQIAFKKVKGALK